MKTDFLVDLGPIFGSKVGPKSVQPPPKVGPESAQSRPGVGPESAQCHAKVGPKSAQSRPEVGPRVGPKSGRISTSGPAAKIPDGTDGSALKS